MSKIKKKRVIKIEYWQSLRDSHWYGRIRGGNGRNIWSSSEGNGYERRAGVTNAINVLIRGGLNAHVTQIKDPNIALIAY